MDLLLGMHLINWNSKIVVILLGQKRERRVDLNLRTRMVLLPLLHPEEPGKRELGLKKKMFLDPQTKNLDLPRRQTERTDLRKSGLIPNEVVFPRVMLY